MLPLGQCFSSVHVYYLEGLLNHIAVPYSRISDLVGLKQDPRLCVSKSPSNANADNEPSISHIEDYCSKSLLQPSSAFLTVPYRFESVPQSEKNV